MLMSFVAARFGTTFIYGQSERGVRPLLQHIPDPGRLDLVVPFKRFSMSAVIMLVHTYYGYNRLRPGPLASARPSAGRCARRWVVSAVVILFVSPRHLWAHRQLPHVRITPWAPNQDCNASIPLVVDRRTRRHRCRADRPEYRSVRGESSPGPFPVMLTSDRAGTGDVHRRQGEDARLSRVGHVATINAKQGRPRRQAAAGHRPVTRSSTSPPTWGAPDQGD